MVDRALVPAKSCGKFFCCFIRRTDESGRRSHGKPRVTPGVRLVAHGGGARPALASSGPPGRQFRKRLLGAFAYELKPPGVDPARIGLESHFIAFRKAGDADDTTHTVWSDVKIAAAPSVSLRMPLANCYRGMLRRKCERIRNTGNRPHGSRRCVHIARRLIREVR